MARDYGNSRAANIAVRLSEQEKEQVKAEAQAHGMTVSELVRLALDEYFTKEVQE